MYLNDAIDLLAHHLALNIRAYNVDTMHDPVCTSGSAQRETIIIYQLNDITENIQYLPSV